MKNHAEGRIYMTRLLKKIHKWENDFDRRAERYAMSHPYMSLFIMIIVMPIVVLAAVCLCTLAICLPLSLLVG